MTLLRFTVLTAGLALAAAAECDVCHLHYYHKDVSSKEIFGADVTHCREYASESCCTAKTAKGVSTEGYLYGEGYNVHGCGTVSSTCQKFFIEESCFYECDKNMGKWRKHEECKDYNNASDPTQFEDNGWQIEHMPVKASYCDAWYEACKEDSICAGPTKSYFEMPDCLAKNKKEGNTNGCKKFKDVYANGKEVCEVMWGKSFKYETDETKAYVMTFKEGTENPNNLVFTDKDYPATCEAHAVNVTHPDGVAAEESGCPANWHMYPNSGHPKNGTFVPTKSSAGRPAAFAGFAAAVFSSAVMMFLA